MDSSRSPLTRLQEDLLREFFSRERSFFLTGGAALAGFYLHHRATDDLDLFATAGADLRTAELALRSAASACGAKLTSVRDFPDFHRFLTERGAERCIVDLVIDRAPQLEASKQLFGEIRVDSLREIIANKFCALFGRSELRDLIDLRRLLALTPEVDAALRDAEKKDAGIAPAELAWVLEQFEVPTNAPLSDGTAPRELEAFRQALIADLKSIAFQRSSPSQR